MNLLLLLLWKSKVNCFPLILVDLFARGFLKAPALRLSWNYAAEDFMMKVRVLAQGCKTMGRFKALERCMSKYIQAYEFSLLPSAQLCR